MSNLEEYNILMKELKEVEDSIQKLKNDKKIKRYNYLSFKRDILKSNITDLYREIKSDEYASCHHLLITTSIKKIDDNDEIKTCGCLKCGLNEKVKYNGDWLIDYDKLSLDEQIMLDFLNNHQINKNSIINVTCNLDLAMAIYSRIKKVHPKINDKLAIKYLEIALDNIRNINVTEERKQSRIKRLGLNPNFNNWN